MICLVLIGMIMSQKVEAERKYLKFLDCNQPKPPLFCQLMRNERFPNLPTYDRGCSPIGRCRGGGTGVVTRASTGSGTGVAGTRRTNP